MIAMCPRQTAHRSHEQSLLLVIGGLVRSPLDPPVFPIILYHDCVEPVVLNKRILPERIGGRVWILP